MPAFTTSVTHKLGTAAATERLKTFLEDVRRDHGDKLTDARGEWQGNTLHFSFSIFGMGIQGTMEVSDSGVNVNGKLPLAAAFFRGQVEKSIRDELVKELSKPA
jgi:hypothetical protein